MIWFCNARNNSHPLSVISEYNDGNCVVWNTMENSMYKIVCIWIDASTHMPWKSADSVTACAHRPKQTLFKKKARGLRLNRDKQSTEFPLAIVCWKGIKNCGKGRQQQKSIWLMDSDSSKMSPIPYLLFPPLKKDKRWLNFNVISCCAPFYVLSVSCLLAMYKLRTISPRNNIQFIWYVLHSLLNEDIFVSDWLFVGLYFFYGVCHCVCVAASSSFALQSEFQIKIHKRKRNCKQSEKSWRFWVPSNGISN